MMALLSSSALSRICCARTSTISYVFIAPRHISTTRQLSLRDPVVRIDLKDGPSNFRDEGHGPMKASHHWTMERALAATMFMLVPTTIIVDTPVLNWAAISAVTLHAYWGVDGVLLDYLMERKFGRYPQYLFRNLWKIICLMGFAGMAYFNFNDVGIASALKRLWAIQG